MGKLKLVLPVFISIAIASCGGGGGSSSSSSTSTSATATTQFDGSYAGGIIGTMTPSSGGTSQSVGAPLTLTVANGAITATGTNVGTGTGTISSAGVVSFTIPASSSGTLGAPCSDIIFTGNVVPSSAGGAVMAEGTFTAAGGGIDPAHPSGTCPSAFGTWSTTDNTSTTATAGQLDGNYAGVISGIMTPSGSTAQAVGASISLAIASGVVTVTVPNVTNPSVTGTVSSTGAITFTIPASTNSLGNPCSDITFNGNVITSTLGGAEITAGTFSAPGGAGVPDPTGTGTCPVVFGTWSATGGTSTTATLSQFDGSYTGGVAGTMIMSGGGSQFVSSALSLTVSNGVITGTGTNVGPATGTVSSTGAITFTIPAGSNGSGAPCTTITFVGGNITTSSGTTMAGGTFTAPSSSTCPSVYGTWSATL